MLSAPWPGWWPWLRIGKGNEKVGNGRKQRRLEVSVVPCRVGEGYEKGWGRDYIGRCHKKVLFVAPGQGTQLINQCLVLTEPWAENCSGQVSAKHLSRVTTFKMQHIYVLGNKKIPQRPQCRASEMTKMWKWENILEINSTVKKSKLHAGATDTLTDIGSSE